MIKENKVVLVILIIAVVVIIGLIISVCFSILPYKSGFTKGTVSINGKIFKVEVAKSAEAQAQGLQGREKLAENQGMLFAFEEKRYHNFWMDGMKIPLDIIWIDDNKIIDITPNVPAPTENQTDLPIYNPPQEVNYVLEINAGLAEKNNFKKGDSIQINIK